MRQQGNSGPVFEFCFFCFCFRGNNHNSSDLCKKYSEISLYKYSLQNKHIYTYLCTCRLFTNIDQKISASSDRVPINCNEEEVKPKLQSEKEVCLFFRRGCSLFLFVFSDKNSTFFSESVTVFSSLIWYDGMVWYLRAGGRSLVPAVQVHSAEQALQWRLARDESPRSLNRFSHMEPEVCHQSWEF